MLTVYLDRVESRKCEAVVVADMKGKKLKAQTVKYTTVSFILFKFIDLVCHFCVNSGLWLSTCTRSFPTFKRMATIPSLSVFLPQEPHGKTLGQAEKTRNSNETEYNPGKIFFVAMPSRLISLVFPSNYSLLETKKKNGQCCAMVTLRMKSLVEHHLCSPSFYPSTRYMKVTYFSGFTLLFLLMQFMVETLLEYNKQWLEETNFTQQRGQWLYALLAKLEKPLKPEMCSLIRTLARLCSTFRVQLASVDDPLLAQLNLFICLVGRYFDQSDLADPMK